MKTKFLSIFILVCFALIACAKTDSGKTTSIGNQNISAVKAETKNDSEKQENTAAVENAKISELQTKQPKTVREFFNLLPQEYFPLEGCEPATDKNCERARKEYVKTYLEVEDTANGYWKSGCDGGQRCLTFALFKRANSSYIVAVHTIHETDEQNYFLEYKNGKWTDISTEIVPEFSNKNIYELPQKGTTVEVFKKNFPEPDWSERGEKLYDLMWKNGKFQKQN